MGKNKNLKFNKLLMAVFICLQMSCNSENQSKDVKNDNSQTIQQNEENMKNNIVNPKGTTIETRYNVPAGYKRVQAEEGSFAQFLRNQKLKPYGEKALFFNGEAKRSEGIYDSVIDVEIGDRDLHQCADAIMLLRGEYFYSKKEYDKINFKFVSGFDAKYSKWMEGYRINPEGKGSYYKKTGSSNTYKDFRNFMTIVFAYSGTLSLENEMKPQALKDMKIGDVFIMGGSPGHAVIIVDMAVNDKGEKIFMLAQSYMPAQQTQILINPENSDMKVWYSLKNKDILVTPQWRFSVDKLRSF
ncbi:hypothetical protein JCM16774_0576 [Pseudoleptotrichia goodfellowii]|uniref:Lipoprotein n=2 Tax=Pseudoleptotrichia goodfellowii TaxID=157692 RepID=A0A510JB57_9FUSO|nr:hypothetical protein JCM16774_0576 [Pseudoleptotrichia goodfellowii]